MTPPSFFRTGRQIAAFAALGILLTLGTARANSYYTYELDTTAYLGQSGVLAFDLIDGDTTPNNTLYVSGFNTDGSLADATPVQLADINFFNEVLRDIVFGSFLNFKIHLSENFAGGTPDSFRFFLLDPFALVPLATTSDPTGVDAHFAIDITGDTDGAASAYVGTLSAVPDAGSALALVLIGFASLIAFARRSRQH